MLILSLALADQTETENSMRRQIPARVCASPHQCCQCAAPLQSKFVFDLRLIIKHKIFEATYRSAPKINTVIRIRDLLYFATRRTNATLNVNAYMLGAFGSGNYYLCRSVCLPKHSEPIISLP